MYLEHKERRQIHETPQNEQSLAPLSHPNKAPHRATVNNLQEPDGAWFTSTVFPYAWDVYTLLNTDIFRETSKYESGHRNTSHRTSWKGRDITNKTGTATVSHTLSIGAVSAPAPAWRQTSGK